MPMFSFLRCQHKTMFVSSGSISSIYRRNRAKLLKNGCIMANNI